MSELMGPGLQIYQLGRLGLMREKGYVGLRETGRQLVVCFKKEQKVEQQLHSCDHEETSLLSHLKTTSHIANRNVLEDQTKS